MQIRNPHMAHLSLGYATWTIGAVSDSSLIHYLKVDFRCEHEPLLTSYKIETSLNSLFHDYNYPFLPAIAHVENNRGGVYIFFKFTLSEADLLIDSLSNHLRQKYPEFYFHIRHNLQRGPAVSMDYIEKRTVTSNNVEVIEPPTAPIIALRSSIFYTPIVSQLECFLTDEQKLHTAKIKKEVFAKFRPGKETLAEKTETQNFEANKLTEKALKEFLITRKGAVDDIDEMKLPARNWSAPYLQAKKAFDRGNIDQAIQLYNDLACKPNIGIHVEAEIYYELYLLYTSKNAINNKLISLHKSYVALSHLSRQYPNSQNYYEYWSTKVLGILIEDIEAYCSQVENNYHEYRAIIANLKECYLIVKSLVPESSPDKAYYEFWSTQILALLFTKIEKYCEEMRNNIEQKHTKSTDPFVELLQADLEYKLESNEGYSAKDRCDLFLMSRLPARHNLANITLITQSPAKLVQFDCDGEKKEILGEYELIEILKKLHLNHFLKTNLKANECKPIKNDLSAEQLTELVDQITAKGGQALTFYVTHTTSLETDLKIDKFQQPGEELLKNKKEYRKWLARYQQPYKRELQYAGMLFPNGTKRFPPVTDKLNLPQPKGYSLLLMSTEAEINIATMPKNTIVLKIISFVVTAYFIKDKKLNTIPLSLTNNELEVLEFPNAGEPAKLLVNQQRLANKITSLCGCQPKTIAENTATPTELHKSIALTIMREVMTTQNIEMYINEIVSMEDKIFNTNLEVTPSNRDASVQPEKRKKITGGRSLSILGSATSLHSRSTDSIDSLSSNSESGSPLTLNSNENSPSTVQYESTPATADLLQKRRR